ncbi:hypothetical protein D9758_001325 [Tetrapyrgos nigripes]|uniref:DUF962-domain-containing protein n=1 Tax=Tetrapyrgos nigripes TaxID=182062 RepID=A0A8H5GS48_9AGAR|nr:hypothetical protein D9758_001325 [Tetrapyrgos nigripes]
MPGSIFDVSTQLTFYGAYHSNRVNVLIHILCVPFILWSAQVLLADVPHPSWLPEYYHVFNEYLAFDLNLPAVFTTVYILYYFMLEPVAAALYVPQLTLSLLTATAFAQRPDHIRLGAIVHSVCWIAQFIGHGFAEKRAPALLDNLIGAVVLAPFFVHLEILFALGYRPEMHKQIQNGIGKEITRIRKIEGDKKRAKQA